MDCWTNIQSRELTIWGISVSKCAAFLQFLRLDEAVMMNIQSVQSRVCAKRSTSFVIGCIQAAKTLQLYKNMHLQFFHFFVHISLK